MALTQEELDTALSKHGIPAEDAESYGITPEEMDELMSELGTDLDGAITVRCLNFA